MCGIAGIFSRSVAPEALGDRLDKMSRALFHRGPDSGGSWSESASGVYLAHRRLSIIDLSPLGAQPMVSADEQAVITFNGEIYNYGAIRSDLSASGVNMRGKSDTEVLVEALRLWGVHGGIVRCRGMFAFAYFDRSARALYLCRDRMGEKPLYYGWSRGAFVFASELKALDLGGESALELDTSAVAAYFRYGYIPSPVSIFRGIRKLPPGCILKLDIDACSPGYLPAPIPYWSTYDAMSAGVASPLACSREEAAQRLDQLLREAVAEQMVADVPVGAFLSGGVDSSLITAMMQAGSTRKIRTFTIGFGDNEYNEAGYARSIADRLGTDHQELVVADSMVAEVVGRLGEIGDEPIADSSLIPTYLVSRLAREHVTVSLTGDGGDELFGGYVSYKIAMDVWRGVRWLPKATRRGLAGAIEAVSPATLIALARTAGFALGAGSQAAGARLADRLYKVAAVLDGASPADIHHRLGMSGEQLWLADDVDGPIEVELARAAREDCAGIKDILSTLTYLDQISYLPDNILCKVDRAAMAVSLEGRIPLLDPRIVEFSAKVPGLMKMNRGAGKLIMRDVLQKYLPLDMFDRQKQGFAPPMARWLRGPLKDWAYEQINMRAVAGGEMIDAKVVRRYWDEHQSGLRNRHREIWEIAVFGAWLRARCK